MCTSARTWSQRVGGREKEREGQRDRGLVCNCRIWNAVALAVLAVIVAVVVAGVVVVVVAGGVVAGVVVIVPIVPMVATIAQMM